MPTVVLIVLCHKMTTLRADRANSCLVLKMKEVCFLDFHTMLLFNLLIAITQQVIGRYAKCCTHLFQYRNGRHSILADDIPKVT